MQLPPLRQMEIPQPTRLTLDNGLVFYLLENHDFPVVDARALLQVGSVYDPPEKVGLATITGEVLRSGGSLGSTGDELDLRLESMGASAEISIGETRGNASVSALSEDAPAAIEILADLLRRPAFPEDKLDLAKKQARTTVASRNDTPMDILVREFGKVLYGPDHPYARHEEYATIDAIARQDLVDFHREYFHPDRILLTVYGDFEPSKMEAAIRRAFGDWPKSTRPLPPLPEVPPLASKGTYLIEKSDMTNSGVLIGQPSIRMDDPDYPELELFSQILGGGFSSRLFNEIRTKRGLAYSTGASLGANYDRRGAFIAFAVTQADSTVRTLGHVRRNVEEILAAPVTDEELQRAKDSVLNSLVFDLASRSAVLARLAEYESYGYPADFLQRYQAAIAEVTAEEIQLAAKRRIDAGEFAVVMVGNPERFRSDLATLGAVQQIDITIPEASDEILPPATEADFARGTELLTAAASAAGGAALQRIRDVEMLEEGMFSVQGREMAVTLETTKLLPDCERAVQKLPFGALTMVTCAGEGWMDAGQGAEDAPADMMTRASAERARDVVTLLMNLSGLRAQPLAPGMVGDRPVDILYIHHPTIAAWKLYLDRETHRIVQMDYRDRSPFGGAPVQAEERLSDYRTVDGVLWPHQRVILHDGQPFATITATSVRFNTGVTRGRFARPTP